MNLLDLAFKYDIEIDYDGDFDGGNYYINLTYWIATQSSVGVAKEELILKQSDIDALYDGATKLVKLLEKHVTEGY
jgi:hypothetical protein